MTGEEHVAKRRYRVQFETSAWCSVTVEAADEDEAVDLAYEEIPSGVCAQCSGWGQSWSLGLGDFELAKDDEEFKAVVEECGDGS